MLNVTESKIIKITNFDFSKSAVTRKCTSKKHGVNISEIFRVNHETLHLLEERGGQRKAETGRPNK